MNQAELLYHLQEIEVHIAQLQKRLNEIAAALADNQTIAAAEAQVKAAEEKLAPFQTRTRNLELEIQSNNEKMKQTDEALYSGRVRNPKELQEMQQEIVSLKRRMGELEDTLLETMVLVEGAEAERTQHQAHLQQIRADWENEHSHLLEEQSRLTGESAELRQKRQQALPGISEDSLKAYNALKPRKNNQPMALLINESCSVCRVEQERAIVQEVRRGQKLTACSSCGRMLVYGSG